MLGLCCFTVLSRTINSSLPPAGLTGNLWTGRRKAAVQRYVSFCRGLLSSLCTQHTRLHSAKHIYSALPHTSWALTRTSMPLWRTPGGIRSSGPKFSCYAWWYQTALFTKELFTFPCLQPGMLPSTFRTGLKLSGAAKHAGPSFPQCSCTLQSQSHCYFAQVKDRSRMKNKMAASLQCFPAATTCLLPSCCQETQKAHLLLNYPKPDCPEKSRPAATGTIQSWPSQPAHPLPGQVKVESVLQLEPHVAHLPKNTWAISAADPDSSGSSRLVVPPLTFQPMYTHRETCWNPPFF